MSTKIITSKNFNSNILQFLPSNIDGIKRILTRTIPYWNENIIMFL